MANQYDLAFGRKVRDALGKASVQPTAAAPQPSSEPTLAKSIDDADLEKLIAAEPMAAHFIAQDFARIAGLWANEATRPQAETMLKSWEEHGEPLRKAMATAWLARAKSVLAHGMPAKAAHGASDAASETASKIRDPHTWEHKHAQRERMKNHSQRTQQTESGHADRPAPAPPGQYQDPRAGHARLDRGKKLRTAAKVAAGSLAGAGAVGAGARYVAGRQLTEKQKEERKVAANARWHGGGR